jgi:hypothetical protein
MRAGFGKKKARGDREEVVNLFSLVVKERAGPIMLNWPC